MGRLARFLAQLVRAQHRDQLLVRAAALAYTTLVSIVPLLTVALVTVGRVQPDRAAALVGAIATVLPFSPARVQATLSTLAQRTAALGWVAVAISVLVTFNAFWQIEEVINAIWGLPRRRRWEVRLVSFATLLVTGPLLVAALFSGLYWLSSQPWYAMIALLARPLPALLAAVTLTVLYRWVPHTHVSWRAAVAGGGVGALALTILHLTFQTYISLASDLNVIYGSLAILLFFLVSLLLFWFAVLLGAEASWVVGHTAAPVRANGVQALVDLLLGFYREGRLSTDAVVRTLGHSGPDVLASLATSPPILLADGSGWRLARSAESITVGEVRERAGIEPAPDETGNPDSLTLAALAKQLNSDGEHREPDDVATDGPADG
jgi:YihY family inner membrane protein